MSQYPHQSSFRLCQLVSAKGGTTLVNQTYGYDVNSNVTAITDPIGGNQSYTYDNNDRIYYAAGPVFNMYYGSDPVDNLTYWPVVGHYAYPPSQLGYGHHPHAVCGTDPGTPTCTTGAVLYTYDASGNMLTGAGRTLVYDAVNRLTSVTTAGGATSFVYDGDGARVQKTVPIGGGSTKTVKYFDKWVECETSGGTTACTKYIWAGDLRVAMKQVTGGALTYYHADRLGTTAVVTDGAGTQQESIQYYPFGEQWTDTGTANVPYKYTGQEYDASTGLYFYQARYYDAHLGRFIQPDTIVPDVYDPASWNAYSYVLNNPLKYTDPDGHGQAGVIESSGSGYTVPFLGIAAESSGYSSNPDYQAGAGFANYWSVVNSGPSGATGQTGLGGLGSSGNFGSTGGINIGGGGSQANAVQQVAGAALPGGNVGGQDHKGGSIVIAGGSVAEARVGSPLPGLGGGAGDAVGSIIGAGVGVAVGRDLGARVGLGIGFAVGGSVGLGAGPLGSIGGAVVFGVAGQTVGGLVGGLVGGFIGGHVGGLFDSPCAGLLNCGGAQVPLYLR